MSKRAPDGFVESETSNSPVSSTNKSVPLSRASSKDFLKTESNSFGSEETGGEFEIIIPFEKNVSNSASSMM